MVTPFKAIEEVRGLIRVPAVTSLVSSIYAADVEATELTRAMNANEKFIVVNYLTQDFDQIQEGVLNVNIYAPLLNGTIDGAGLDAILIAIKPLLEDATTNLISTWLGRPSIFKEDNKPYYFYNQRVNYMAINLNQNQNIKLN